MRHSISASDTADIRPDYRASRWPRIGLAGGCFWGVEAWFKQIAGILHTECGYANGLSEETDYRHLGETDHAETVLVWYDPGVIPLPQLLTLYGSIIDPFSINRQGSDCGRQYRTGIYYTDPADRPVCQAFLSDIEAAGGQKPAVELAPLSRYVPAEPEHQDYLARNPGGYCHIPLNRVPDAWRRPADPTDRWTQPDDAELRRVLDETTYRITREACTEQPHTSPLLDSWEPGLYVDRLSGQPLFISAEKFESGCGWPAFAAPIESAVSYRDDYAYGRHRIEVRSTAGDNHLGHVFEDGPAELGGLRYCINGAALRFIPLKELEVQGYGAYRRLFPTPSDPAAPSDPADPAPSPDQAGDAADTGSDAAG